LAVGQCCRVLNIPAVIHVRRGRVDQDESVLICI
jgi:hypothetical protein